MAGKRLGLDRFDALAATAATTTAFAASVVAGWGHADEAVLTLTAVFSAAFTGVYIRSARRHTTRTGRDVMGLHVVLTLILLQGSVSDWTEQDYPGRTVIRIVLYAALTVALARLTRNAVQHRRSADHEE